MSENAVQWPEGWPQIKPSSFRFEVKGGGLIVAIGELNREGYSASIVERGNEKNSAMWYVTAVRRAPDQGDLFTVKSPVVSTDRSLS